MSLDEAQRASRSPKASSSMHRRRVVPCRLLESAARLVPLIVAARGAAWGRGSLLGLLKCASNASFSPMGPGRQARSLHKRSVVSQAPLCSLRSLDDGAHNQTTNSSGSAVLVRKEPCCPSAREAGLTCGDTLRKIPWHKARSLSPA